MNRTDQKIIEMMSKASDLNSGVETSYRYCLLTVPRSGSWLLSMMLGNTGLCGLPMEYLNVRYLRAYGAHAGVDGVRVNEYLSELEQRRTSENGVFGLKMHWSQFLNVYGTDQGIRDEGRQFLSQMDCLIRLYRQDKVAQAVSHYIAEQSDQWRVDHDDVEEDSFDMESIKFAPLAITESLLRLVREEQMWKRYLERRNIPYHSISYEQLAGEYEESSRTVLSWMGLDGQSIDIPEPAAKKQANELNERLKQEYVDYIGAAAPQL